MVLKELGRVSAGDTQELWMCRAVGWLVGDMADGGGRSDNKQRNILTKVT